MTKYLYSLLFFLSLALSSLASQAMEAGWTHVELGAANYGDFLGVHDRHAQYQILRTTISSLVETQGETGTLYVNDYDAERTRVCATYLRECLASEYSGSKVQVIELVGDYFKVPVPRCGSIHLKNPEASVLTKLFSGKYNDRLVELARLSETGFAIQTMFHDLDCIEAFCDDRLTRTDVDVLCEPYIWPPDAKACETGTYKRFVLKPQFLGN